MMVGTSNVAVARDGRRAQIWRSPTGWQIGYWQPGAARASATASCVDEHAARRALVAWARDHR